MGTTIIAHALSRAVSNVGRWNPIIALLVWCAIVASIAGLAQAVALACGSSWRVLSPDGHDFLFIASIFGWISIASLDARPMDTFGLAPDERWPRQLIGGFVIGAAIPVVFWWIAVALGGYQPLPDASWWRLVSIIWILPTIFITSYLIQIALSGYVLGMIRSRFGWLAGVVVTGVLFALIERAGYPLFEAATEQRKFIGLAFLGAVLATIRLWTGNIVASGALLTGYFAANQMNHQTGVARDIALMDVAGLLAPYRDMLESRFVHQSLMIVLCVVVVGLILRGVPQPRPDARIARSLKRFYPLGMVSCLAPIDVWLGRLAHARWRVPPIYWIRLTAVLACSAFGTIVTLPERLLSTRLASRRARPAPIFVLGVHRSGTTHLQNLLALDPNVTPARTCHVMNPHGFVSLGWLLMPAVAAFMPWRRPMDRVRYGLFAPNEEEFAIMNMCGLSPHWGMTFPTQWPEYDRAIDPRTLDPAEQRTWERAYLTFVNKLVLFSKKRPLLKNPYNTARMGVLRRLFPDARFIHICRNPFTVVQSNLHLADEGHVLMHLQDPVPGSDYGTRFLANYRMMEDTFQRDLTDAPPGTIATIRFEDLEKDPIKNIRAIYDALGLDWTEAFESRLQVYMDGQSTYRKNAHRALPPDLHASVQEVMAPYIDRWGYVDDGCRAAPTVAGGSLSPAT